MSTPHHHGDTGWHIIEYLAAQGVVRDPDADQEADHPLPAVFYQGLRGQAQAADRAVAILGPWVTADETGSNPAMRFMVSVRGAPWDDDDTTAIAQAVADALQHDEVFSLTADRELAYCQRVLSDPPMQDENRRWVRVDSYQARARVPINKRS